MPWGYHNKAIVLGLQNFPDVKKNVDSYIRAQKNQQAKI